MNAPVPARELLKRYALTVALGELFFRDLAVPIYTLHGTGVIVTAVAGPQFDSPNAALGDNLNVFCHYLPGTCCLRRGLISQMCRCFLLRS